MLELLRGIRISNYLVSNIITNVSIVSNPYKYIIIREYNNMIDNYDKYNLIFFREY